MKPQITRRTLLGGIAAMFAVVAAPAPTVLAIAPVGGPLLDFEILSEAWIENPNDFGWLYRCLARHGDKYANAMAMVGADHSSNLELRAAARADARWLLLRHFCTGGGATIDAG